MNNAMRAAATAASSHGVHSAGKGMMSGATRRRRVRRRRTRAMVRGTSAPPPAGCGLVPDAVGEDHSRNIPMIVIGYEDLYDSKKETVLAIRIWHFVFDKTHSTSDLARKLMNEAPRRLGTRARRTARTRCATKAVQHAKQTRALLGSSLANAHLELASGMCYRHITNVSIYKDLLSYGGKTGDKTASRRST